jgi:hypothetical protein
MLSLPIIGLICFLSIIFLSLMFFKEGGRGGNIAGLYGFVMGLIMLPSAVFLLIKVRGPKEPN